jgi:hypothetical protein
MAGLATFSPTTLKVLKIITSFKKDFAAAKEVKWEISKEFTKATFSLNDRIMFAFYNESGELLAMSRNILSTQLPINLLSDLKKNYSDFWITDLFEMAAGNETNYYITLESADAVVILKSPGTSGWEVFKKDRKVTE